MPKEPLSEETRNTSHDKTTKGTLRWQEDVINDMAVFRSLYVEKWAIPQEVKDNPEDYYAEVTVKFFKR